MFIYYFTSETEGILRHHHKWIDSSVIDNDGHTIDNIYFEYNVSGNTVYIRFIDSYFPRATFTYDGKNLNSGSDVLIPVTPSSGDWGQIRKLLPQTGRTGDCTYTFEPRTGELTITGDGAMADYSAGSQPWNGLGVKKVIFSSGVTSVGNRAFYQCNTLEYVDFPRNCLLKSIGVEAFAKCLSLSSFDIPSSVEIIKEAAFADCTSLKSLSFGLFGSGTPNLKTIESYAFKGTKAYSKTNTGNYSGTKYYYSTLEIPPSVETLGIEAFSGDIDKIVIGKNMKKLSWLAIATSVSSGKMYVNRGTPPSANTSITGQDDSWTLYVPVGCKSAYQKAAVWKNFKSIIEDSSLEKGDDYTGGGDNGNNGDGYDNGDAINGYKTCPDNNHPHMIDLGLPSGTKWACCNVGASKPEQYGSYFAWGETSPKSTYNWSTYIHCNGTYDTCHNIGSDIAGTQYDAATANWGSPWVMPNLEQCKELVNKCTSEWTTQNGVNGRRFTGPNGASIFLPAAGYRWDEDLRYAGSSGGYWSSSLNESHTYYASELYFGSGDVYTDYRNRYGGLSVRPVRKN